MSQELGAPCQSKLGSMIQSRIGSALACPTKAGATVVMMAVLDESGGSNFAWNNSVTTFNLALANLQATNLDGRPPGISAKIVHVLNADGEVEPIGRTAFPPPIIVTQVDERLPTIATLLSAIEGNPFPFYARLAGDNSGSMIFASSPGTPVGFFQRWRDFVAAAKNLTGWGELEEAGRLSASRISPPENVLVDFATAMDEARVLIEELTPSP